MQDQEQQAGARRGGQGTEAVLRTGHRTDFFFFLSFVGSHWRVVINGKP